MNLKVVDAMRYLALQLSRVSNLEIDPVPITTKEGRYSRISLCLMRVRWCPGDSEPCILRGHLKWRFYISCVLKASSFSRTHSSLPPSPSLPLFLEKKREETNLPGPILFDGASLDLVAGPSAREIVEGWAAGVARLHNGTTAVAGEGEVAEGHVAPRAVLAGELGCRGWSGAGALRAAEFLVGGAELAAALLWAVEVAVLHCVAPSAAGAGEGWGCWAGCRGWGGAGGLGGTWVACGGGWVGRARG